VRTFLEGAGSELAPDSRMYYAKSLARMARTLKATYAKQAPKTYEELTTAHAESFVKDLDNVASKEKYMGNARRFLEHLNDQGQGPDRAVIQALRKPAKTKFRGLKHRQAKLPETYSGEELEAIFQSCVSVRDKAFLMCLYATAGRANEIINLKMGDVEIKKYAVRLQDGQDEAVEKMKVTIRESKTKQRVVGPMRLGVREMSEWLRARTGCLQCHGKEPHCPKCKGTGTVQVDPDEPVWITRKLYKGKPRPVTYSTMQRMWQTALAPRYEREKGRSLRGSFHWLRHTRLTALAGSLSAAELEAFAGWTQGSKVVQAYVNGSGVGANGLAQSEGEVGKPSTDMAFLVHPCPACGYELPVGVRFCSQCGEPLDKEAKTEEAKHIATIDRVVPLVESLLARIEKLEAHAT
jgi:integrase/predicted nucleic acid-binding Zn ribbon protein